MENFMKKKLTFYLSLSLFVIPALDTKTIRALSKDENEAIGIGLGAGLGGGIVVFVIISALLVVALTNRNKSSQVSREIPEIDTNLDDFVKWLKSANESAEGTSDNILAKTLKRAIGDELFDKLIASKNLKGDFPLLDKVFDKYRDIIKMSLESFDDSLLEFILQRRDFPKVLADTVFKAPDLIKSESITDEHITDLVYTSLAKLFLVDREYGRLKADGKLASTGKLLDIVDKGTERAGSIMEGNFDDLIKAMKLKDVKFTLKLYGEIADHKKDVMQTLDAQRSTISVSPSSEEGETEIGKTSEGQTVYVDKDGNLYIKTDSGMENILPDEDVRKDGYKFEKMGQSGKPIYKNDLGKSFELQADGSFKSIESVIVTPVEHEPIVVTEPPPVVSHENPSWTEPTRDPVGEF